MTFSRLFLYDEISIKKIMDTHTIIILTKCFFLGHWILRHIYRSRLFLFSIKLFWNRANRHLLSLSRKASSQLFLWWRGKILGTYVYKNILSKRKFPVHLSVFVLYLQRNYLGKTITYIHIKCILLQDLISCERKTITHVVTLSVDYPAPAGSVLCC